MESLFGIEHEGRHLRCMPKVFLLFLFFVPAYGKLVEYDLVIENARWAPVGHTPARAITINGGIPGPTLRFRVGDVARIRVHNRMKDEDTSIHWHGLILPNDQDGVPGVTMDPIRPGTTFVYEFPIVHEGTYWYHSHTSLQEQEGIYGSIVVDDKLAEKKAKRDHVIVLSDWTREPGVEVMRSLARGTEWYEVKKGTAQSVLGAAKAGALKEFFAREKARMTPMDISDVAYDAFLANGRETSEFAAKPGEQVKLRLINAGASTYFFVEYAAGKMAIVAADGPAVQPMMVKRLFIGMGETYDVIVTMPRSGQWEVRATAQDGSGHTSVWLGDGKKHPAPDVPKPDNYRMDSHMAAVLEDHGMSHQANVEAEHERPISPYGRLRSRHDTSFSPEFPRRTIQLRATGDMERYVWSFNGKTFAEDGVIPVKKGEVLRLEFVNDTMMHHPLHLHGHFFRVLMGQGQWSPLKHTIDLPPMSRRTVEFLTDQPGDWLFHCHLLYHMHAGMTRIFSYQPDSWESSAESKVEHVAGKPGHSIFGHDESMRLAHTPGGGEHAHDPYFLLMDGSLQTHMSAGVLRMRDTRNDFYLAWEGGWRKEKGYEADVGWSRYFDPNFSAMMGWRMTDHDGADDRAFAGFYYRFPYLLESSLQFDSEGDVRIGLGKELPLTTRFTAFGDGQYDTGDGWEWSAGVEWMVSKRVSLISQVHSEYGFGGGVFLRF